jgi:hypothetical protein
MRASERGLDVDGSEWESKKRKMRCRHSSGSEKIPDEAGYRDRAMLSEREGFAGCRYVAGV